MKLFLNIYLILIVWVSIQSSEKQFETALPNPNNQDVMNAVIDPLAADKSLERIRYYITEYALIMDRKVDILQKQINTGNLPDGYPTEMKKKAMESRHNIELRGPPMLYVTEVWRGCVFPNYTLSYVSYCLQKYAFSGKQKLNGCRNNFCLVCCDNLQHTFTSVANTEKEAFNLNLDDNLGKENIKLMTEEREIKKCRSACKRHYQVDMPLILPTPPRDKLLGINIDNPAISCMDIKTWGHENSNSGVYWLTLGVKGKIRAYCDLETDGGGWTLFYNYVHKPQMPVQLDATKLPKDLESNSHMDLGNAGFNDYDVKEIRFYCTEKFQQEKNYWHFKTTNPEFIKSAITGDLSVLKPNSLSDYYIELKPNHKINGVFRKSVLPTFIQYFTPINNDSQGGFTNTPFGSFRYKKFWTIKGSNSEKPRYECGTEHNYTNGMAGTTNNPDMVDSHHTIWFRGNAPTKSDAQRRFISKMRSSNYN